MANDEVLAAVERRREASNGQSSWDAIYGDDAEFDEDWDARDLADAYLARLDAEAERERMRAEPVTVERLKSRGFVQRKIDDLLFDIETNRGKLTCMVSTDGWWIGSWVLDDRLIPGRRPETMGQFDDLLRGLGIEPKREGGGG